MTEKDQIGVRVDPETKRLIESQLGYGDSISGWVRVAIEQRLQREGLLGDEMGNRTIMQTSD